MKIFIILILAFCQSNLFSQYIEYSNNTISINYFNNTDGYLNVKSENSLENVGKCNYPKLFSNAITSEADGKLLMSVVLKNIHNDGQKRFAIDGEGKKIKGTESKNPHWQILWSFKDWDNYLSLTLQDIWYGNKNITYYSISLKKKGIETYKSDWKQITDSQGVGTDLHTINVIIDRETLKSYVLILPYNVPMYRNYKEFLYNTSLSGTVAGPFDLPSNFIANIGVSACYGSDIFIDEVGFGNQHDEEIENKEEESVLQSSSGSGIILSKNGYIATNHHVIDGAKTIEVDVFVGGIKKTYLADVINSDKTNDLSLLKIRDEKFLSPTINYGIKTHDVKVGEKVFTLGYPMIDLQGDEIKLTDGIISSKSGFQNDPTTYQISAPIQPGNSGGPLFDINGNLIGITSSKLNSNDAQNVNYAIKVSYLMNFLDIQPNIPTLPSQSLLSGKPLTELVTNLSPVVVLIRVNDKTIKGY